MRKLIFAGLFFVAACATTAGPLANVERLTTFCNTYARTLDTLTRLKTTGQLTARSIEKIDVAEKIVTPACLVGPDNITEDLIDRVLDAAIVLTVYAQE